MSQSFRVYLTDLDGVNAALGSGDLEIVSAIVEELPDDLWEIDDLFDTTEDDGSELTATEALKELIQGSLSRDPAEYEDLYTHVFMLLCHYYGGWLIDDRLSRCSVELLNRLDTHLESGGVPLRVYQLWSRAGVVKHPQIERSLEVGFWTSEEAAVARPALRRLIPTIENEDDRDAIKAIDDWCQQCEKYPECTLVGWLS